MELIAEGRSKGWPAMTWRVVREASSRSARARLDALASMMILAGTSQAGRPIGKGWAEIQRSTGLLRAGNHAREGIAYRLGKPLRPGVKHPDVTRFFGRFGDPSRCFTNWPDDPREEDVEPDRRNGIRTSSFFTWASFSHSTFDMVFGLVDGPLVGILCIEDED